MKVNNFRDDLTDVSAKTEVSDLTEVTAKTKSPLRSDFVWAETSVRLRWIVFMCIVQKYNYGVKAIDFL